METLDPAVAVFGVINKKRDPCGYRQRSRTVSVYMRLYEWAKDRFMV